MSETKTPGILARHMIVRDACRDLHGDTGAIREAVRSIENEARALISGWPKGDGHQLHFVLTVERGGSGGDASDE